MVAFLGVICFLAFGNAIFSVLELLQTWRPGATVFQQISVRLDLGLSLLTMATAGGLAAILEQSRSQTAALAAGLAALRSPPAVVTAPAQTLSPVASRAQAHSSVRMHRGVPFYLIDEEYVATVRGQELKAKSPDHMRERITAVLNG